MPAVTLEAVGLTKRYGTRTAVEDLSLVAHEGEIVGLLGPNGAGKTTTIRLLTTVLPPSSGRFAVAGVPSTRPVEIRRRVGALPESAGYPANQSGEEYLRYHARLFGLPGQKAATVVAGLLSEVGLTERASALISTYSRGMRQRLGIARSLVNDPTVVFLDEPTLGLDPAGQRQVLTMLRAMVDRRRATVILSTHTLPDVEEVCSSVVILNNGRVVASGRVADVVAAAAARRRAQVTVPVDLAGRAREALRRVDGLAVSTEPERPDVLTVSLSAAPGAVPADPANAPDGRLTAALRAVLDAGVPVLAFEVERMRLSDAFLAMTDSEIPR